MKTRKFFNFLDLMETLVLVSIFLAIALSIVGFVMLLKYKHFGDDKLAQIDEKMNSLENMLDSCDNMIHELNKLSDYIISNVEEKSVELKGLIEKADDKIEEVKLKPHAIIDRPVEKPVQEESKEEPPVQSPLLKLSGKFRKSRAEGEAKQAEPARDEQTERIITTPVAPAINAYQSNLNFNREGLKASEVEEPDKVEETYRPQQVEKTVEEPRIFEPVIIERKEESSEKGKMFAFVVSSKAKDVIELAGQGLDTTEIAKRLGIGKGEIELILGMKK